MMTRGMKSVMLGKHLSSGVPNSGKHPLGASSIAWSPETATLAFEYSLIETK